MPIRSLVIAIVIFCAGSVVTVCGHAQGRNNSDGPPPRFGVAAAASTLGAGVQAATAVTQRSNVRLGFNDFSYSTTVHKDGIGYDGTLSLRSAEVLFDQYITGPFHISTGMIYSWNKGTANVAVPGGKSFSLGGMSYYSDAGNPIQGTGAVSLGRKVSPVVLIGFGNLLPRNNRHFTVNLDLGVVFQGAPSAALNLSGSACAGPGKGCLNAATDPTIHANVQNEQAKLNDTMSPFKYYPVVRLSFGYKF